MGILRAMPAACTRVDGSELIFSPPNLAKVVFVAADIGGSNLHNSWPVGQSWLSAASENQSKSECGDKAGKFEQNFGRPMDGNFKLDLAETTYAYVDLPRSRRRR